MFDYMARLKDKNAKLDKAQQILVIEEVYVKPPEPIRINNMGLNSKGVFTVSANGDVKWPEIILTLFNRTHALKSLNLANSEIRRRLKPGGKGGGGGKASGTGD